MRRGMADRLRLYVASVGDHGRGPMAAAFAEAFGDGVEAASGGSDPAEHVLDPVRTAMAEVGVPVLGREPAPIAEGAARQADVVVSIGDRDGEGPSVPRVEARAWDVPDPAGEDLAAVRAIRDEIARRVRGLLREREALDGA